MSVTCSKCGTPLEPEMEKCPKCGSRDRSITLTETITALVMVGVKQKAKGYHRFKKYEREGEKISNHGKLAHEKLTIDKEKKRKRHIVKEKNEKGEWVTVHNEDEPL